MDQATFTQAVERYQDMVFRLALHSLGSPQDADDAVQEVFLRLYCHDGAFEGEEHLRRWLLRVGINYCRDVLKSSYRRYRAPLEEVPPAPQFEKEEQAELYEAVMALPERYRTVLYLFYYEELSVREIADLLRLKPSAVTTRLSRAREKLKQRLGEVWKDE